MKSKGSKKRGPLACINGVKGAISLFLAVLMTPFLTIALLLVDVGRYNSAVSILDEAMGVSSLSTLSNYDDYLQERWGILGLAQDVEIDTVYAENLENNSSAMSAALDITDVTASGMYPLSDLDVLEAQLVEYCKLNAPTKLGSEIVSKAVSLTKLSDILKNLGKLDNVLSLLTKGVSTLDSGITMAESAEELKKSAETLDSLKTEYKNNYSAFASAVNTLIENLQAKRTQENLKAPLEETIRPQREEIASIEKTMAELKKDNKLTSDLKKQYNDRIEDLKEEIAPTEKELEPIEKEIKRLDTAITNGRTSAGTAKTNYVTTITSIITELGNFRDHMAKTQEAAAKIKQNVTGAVTDAISIGVQLEKKRTDLEEKKKDLKALKESVESWDGALDDPSYIAGVEMQIAMEEEVASLQTEIGEMEITEKVAKASQAGIGKMADEWEETREEYSDATIGQVIEGFKSLKGTVNGLDISKITANSSKVTEGKYKSVAVSGYIKADDIQAYLDKQEEDLKKGSLKAMLDGLIGMYNQLMGMSIFFEAKLDATIDMGYYADNFGGLPGGASAENPILNIMKNISNICKKGISMSKNLKDLKLVQLLKDLKAIVENAKSLFENIGKTIKNFLTNIAELFTSYEKYYITTYSTYNLACRTDFSDASNSASVTTMAGYGVGKDSFREPSGLPNPPVLGEIVALVNTIVKCMSGTGSDKMFSGAELEYMLFGSSSEVANQLYVFAALYFIRMLSSLPAIMADAEVQALAASATLGYPVVIALYVLLEPLVQTVLLVNGKAQALIPTEVYLSPSGLPSLVQELVWFCKLTVTQSEALTNGMVSAFTESSEDYEYQKELYESGSPGQSVSLSLKFNYKDYCLVLLLLTVTKEQQVARLANLIQMETLCYYENQEKDYTFDLRKSYSYLYAQVDANVVQMMPSLADSSLFTVERDHYRGY